MEVLTTILTEKEKSDEEYDFIWIICAPNKKDEKGADLSDYD
jgi:hypothetical protein